MNITAGSGTVRGRAALEGDVVIAGAGRARFEFRAAPNDGLNRVTLRRGGESRVLEFWVGVEPPALVRN